MVSYIKKFFRKKEPCGQGEIPAEGQGETLQDRPVGPWIGVDLDGTLAVYTRGVPLTDVGEPVPAMVALVRKMISNGVRVKIFTARAGDEKQVPVIHKWLKSNGLPELEITNIKDYDMLRLYDDRCIQVEANTGRLIVDKKGGPG